MIWTDEMDERIEAMHRDGRTFLAIADAMNLALGLSLSRSAIQGRLARLERWRRAADLKVLPVKLTKPLGQPAELLDLDPDGCKWAVDENHAHHGRHIMCNAHRHDGSAYCWKHYCKSVGFRP